MIQKEIAERTPGNSLHVIAAIGINSALPSFLCGSVKAKVFAFAHAVNKSSGSGHINTLDTNYTNYHELFLNANLICVN